MSYYCFRAECLQDFMQVLNQDIEKEIESYCIQSFTELPDVKVTVKVRSKNKNRLEQILYSIPDGHVMYETVENPVAYTGVRDYNKDSRSNNTPPVKDIIYVFDRKWYDKDLKGFIERHSKSLVISAKDLLSDYCWWAELSSNTKNIIVNDCPQCFNYRSWINQRRARVGGKEIPFIFTTCFEPMDGLAKNLEIVDMRRYFVCKNKEF